MNKIILALLLTISLAAPANAQNCVNASRCDGLGYKQTPDECRGLSTLICPFDENKVFCVYTPQAYSCEQMYDALVIPNNRVVSYGKPSGVGNYACQVYRMEKGSSLIGIPDVSLTGLESFYMAGDNLLKNVKIAGDSKLVVYGKGKITIEESTIHGIDGSRSTYNFFSEIHFRGNNQIDGDLKNCLKIISDGKLSVINIVNEQKTGEIITQELDCIAASNSSCSIKNTHVNSEKISGFWIEESEIHSDKIYTSNLSCKNSKIYGDIYFQSMSSFSKGCELSGRIFIKPDQDFYMYGLAKSGSEIYISPSDNPNKIYIDFEKDVTVGYGSDLWKTNRPCHVNIANIASCADRIGDFSGITYPEDLPF